MRTHDRQPTRILIVANDPLECTPLLEDGRRSATDGRALHVLVVAPALNGRLRHWLSDCDAAERKARARLRRCVDGLAEAGVEANGMVGDADPLQAMDDALRLFPADEVVIATQAEERSNWLARGLVERARRRFAVPIRHVVVEAALPAQLAAA